MYARLEGRRRRTRRFWVRKLCESCARWLVGDDGFEARIRKKGVRGSVGGQR